MGGRYGDRDREGGRAYETRKQEARGFEDRHTLIEAEKTRGDVSEWRSGGGLPPPRDRGENVLR